MARWPGLIALRLVRLALLLAFVSLVAFALAKLSPIDPINAYLGADMARVGPEQRAMIAARWGLDQPPAQQFFAWLGNLAQGDLGFSMTYNAPVAEVLAGRFAASLPLLALAWLFSGALGFALGIAAGASAGSWLDRIIRLYAYVLAATPTFWLAMVLLMVFSVSLNLTPVCCAAPIGVLPQEVSFIARLHHLVLPLFALTVFGVAQIALHTRAKMVEIMQSDYVLQARAQGASTGEIAVLHGARNAALPALTVQFATLGEIFGGAILVEQVFAYPGLGRATVEAGLRGDVPLLLAITLVLSAFVFTGNAIADLLYSVLDPRLRHAEGLRALR